MTARTQTHRLLPALVVVSVAFGGCASFRGAAEEEKAESGAASQIISREEIMESNAPNLWEALRTTVRYVHWGVGDAGSPQRGTRRGVTSGRGPERVRVVMDGSEIHDFGQLRLMPTHDVAEIRVLSGVDATTYFGTNSVAGAVLITTRR